MEEESLDSGWRDADDRSAATSSSSSDTGTILRALLSGEESGWSAEPTEENGEPELADGRLRVLEASPRMTALAAFFNNMGVLECEASSVEFRTSEVLRPNH